MSVDILGTSWDQCRSMVQYSLMSTETIRLVRMDSPGRPPRLSHSSWTMKILNRPFSFILLLHNGNQSELTTKFYNSSKADVWGKVLTLTTEIWQDWISLDAHRLSKISSSFNLFTEKEALAPGWLLLFFLFFLKLAGCWCEWSALAIQVCVFCLYECVEGEVCMCVCVYVCECAGVSMSERCCVSACQFHFALYD